MPTTLLFCMKNVWVRWVKSKASSKNTCLLHSETPVFLKENIILFFLIDCLSFIPSSPPPFHPPCDLLTRFLVRLLAGSADNQQVRPGRRICVVSRDGRLQQPLRLRTLPSPPRHQNHHGRRLRGADSDHTSPHRTFPTLHCDTSSIQSLHHPPALYPATLHIHP